jgi:menaquinone-specific isochorismate synthase
MMELAVFGAPGGGLVVGEGPFEARSTPPSEGVAFYRNDFALSSSEPWRIPAVVRELAPGEELPQATKGVLAVAWEEPGVDPFAEVYGEVSQAIRSGSIEKSVPVIAARGRLKAGKGTHFLKSLSGVEAPLRPYGWIAGDEGFAGLSPELLFRREGGTLHTMALAGTARSEEREAFGVDEKEIREHEFVAQTLLAKLSDLGITTRHPREIMDLARLVHFHSGIDVELKVAESTNRLVQVLHPTPALGPLPRTEETMSQLIEWRSRLNCPPWFGAPFGLMRDGVFEALVAIRMVVWSGQEVLLPSGCGVIEESRFVNEWRELRLKREAVRAAFDL